MEQAKQDNKSSTSMQLVGIKGEKETLKAKRDDDVKIRDEAEAKVKQRLNDMVELKLMYQQADFDLTKLKLLLEDTEKQ